MDVRKYYEILELTPGVSREDVAQAYKDLVNVWHPDRFSKIPRLRKKAEKKLKEVNEAYEKLQSHLSELEQLKRQSNARTAPHGNPISRGTAHEKQKKTSRKLIRTYPLTRCLARFIDYLLFGLLLGSLNVYGILLRFEVPAPLFSIITIFGWVFVEAAFLSVFGTSPGKWLLKTTIMDKSLEKPGYFLALRRSLSVWCNGMGTGIFFIAPVTMAISYQRLQKDGYAPWDREGRFYLIHGKIGTARYFFSSLLFVIFSVSNTYQIHEQMDLMPVNIEDVRDPDEMRAQREETASMAKNTTARERQLQATADYADAQYRLGKACYELGRYKEAIEALKQVVQLRPDFAEARYGLGISYANMRLYKDATESLLQAIQLKPDYAAAHHILGFVYLDMGQKEAAMKQQEILKGLDKGLANELLAYMDIPARLTEYHPR